MSNQPNPDFNWDDFGTTGKFANNYSKDEKASMEAMYEGTMTEIVENKVMMGTVVTITEREVVINIGFKSDGLVPRSEFRDMENLAVGDELEVLVEELKIARTIFSNTAQKVQACKPSAVRLAEHIK